MRTGSPTRFRSLLGLVALALTVVAWPAAAQRPAPGAPLQAAFASAAREWGVPADVLLAVAYNQSRWEHHAGKPSTSGGFGVMHLTDVDLAAFGDRRGDGRRPAPAGRPVDANLQTLRSAAKLLGLPPDTLKRDPLHNIRGGAALLAQAAREVNGSLPRSDADWYAAVARYSGARDAVVALGFADAVYRTLREGASRMTNEGERVTVKARAITPNKEAAARLRLRQTPATAECPPDLPCNVVPAAYERNTPDDPSDYGNYDVANRDADGPRVRYIVVHNTEITYDTTIAAFQNPKSYVSSHYVLRSSDGLVTQMVANKDVAWTAGNWYINAHSINLEHEGIAIEGAAWYSEQMYQASARLVRYLAARYGIPLDRAHILGHDEVPGPTPANQTAMHWDPGPFWDWARYMELIGAPIEASAKPTPGVVTLRPNFKTNSQPLSYCYEDGCRDLPPQPTNFVYLRTAPSADAPLLDDPALPGPGTTRAPDWGNKAATGARYLRVERRGDWDAIYFGGQKAWFYNPAESLTVPGSGMLVTPKEGVDSIPVYGRAYPEAMAYPEGIAPQAFTPLQYSIPAGQVYVATELVDGAYYWSPTQSERGFVQGATPYYVIYFNRRMAFVRASDVHLVWPVGQTTPVGPTDQ